MQLLSLTIENLNSLKGKWHIDFTQPAFTDSGVFAITGPTGAGKTTILDAICLALYGQTPRLGKVSGDNEIMNRLAGVCSAEVEIATQQGHYRVYWGQRRAREKNTGKLQNAHHEISNLKTGKIIATKLTETPKMVAEVTGMDFTQFTQAALLAQGQFAAFLQANSTTRGNILEQLTGTGIYGTLSQRTHERLRQENETLQSLEQVLGITSVRDDEAFAALQEAFKALQTEIDTANKTLLAKRTLKQQHETLAKCAQELQTLSTQRAKIAQDNEDFKANFERLERHQQTQQGGVVFAANEAAVTNVKSLETALGKARLEAERQQGICQQAEQNHQLALAQFKKETDAQTAAQPLINQAREQDAALQQLRLTLTNAQNELAELNAPKPSILQAMLAAPPVETLRAQYQEALAGRSVEEVQDALRAHERREQQLTALAGEYQRLEKAQAQLAKLAAARNENATTQQALQGKLTAAEGSLKQADEHYRLATQARELAQVVASLEEHRAQLQENTPCPLCGALEHPYADAHQLPNVSEVDKAYRNAQKQLGERQQTRNELHAQVSAAAATGQQLTTQYAEKHAEIGAQSEAIAARAQTLQVSAETLAEATAQVRQLIENTQRQLKQIYELNQLIEARRYQKKQAAVAEIETQLKTLTAERQALFSSSCDAYAAQLHQAVQRAEAQRTQANEQLSAANTALTVAKSRVINLEDEWQQSTLKAQQCAQAFTDFLGKMGFASREAYLAARLPESELTRLQTRAQQLKTETQRLANLAQSLVEKREALSQQIPENSDYAALCKQLEQLEQEAQQRQEKRGELKEQLRIEDENRAKRATQLEKILAQKQIVRKWQLLEDLIGSASGDKFRKFAQGITFDTMIAHANHALAKMTDRYTLLRDADDEKEPLQLSVIDHYQGDNRRSTRNLSGGEGFLISLALALGLSAMAGEKIRIDSLFLDEGFGTLDEETLDTALSALAALHQEGKMIGMISHVSAMQERIATQIRVIPQTGGVSQLKGAGIRKLA